MTKTAWKPGTMVYPLPPVMVTCGTMDKPNVFTAAWTGIINSEPAMTYVSIRPSRYSYELIKENNEFVINLTTQALLNVADFCGVKSGRDMDKFAETGLTIAPCGKVKAPMLEQSPVSVECRVTEIKPLGSHDMFLAEILAVNVNTDLIDENGRFALERSGLVAFCHGAYYAVGKELGTFGFSVAKKKTRKQRITAIKTERRIEKVKAKKEEGLQQDIEFSEKTEQAPFNKFEKEHSKEGRRPFKKEGGRPFRKNREESFEKHEDRPYKKAGDKPLRQTSGELFEKRERRPFKKDGDKPFNKSGDRPFRKSDDGKLFEKREDRPYKKSGDRPFKKDGDKPFRKSGDRPFKKSDDSKKPFEKRGDKPYKRSGDKPFKRSDDGKPFEKRERRPFKEGENKPFKKSGGRPFKKDGDKPFKKTTDRKPYQKSPKK